MSIKQNFLYILLPIAKTGMPRFEDAYIGDIVAAVVTELGVFKRPPSMLLLGKCALHTPPV